MRARELTIAKRSPSENFPPMDRKLLLEILCLDDDLLFMLAMKQLILSTPQNQFGKRSHNEECFFTGL